MDINPSKLEHRKAHDLLTGLIIPRPIAWVTTVGDGGTVNLAPFSMFNLVAWSPPTLSICAVNRPDGSRKDTVRNILSTGQFVVSLVSEELAPKMAATSATLPYEVDEAARESIQLSPSMAVAPPRVLDAKAAFECELDRIITVGEGANAGNLILGTIRNVHLQEGLLGETGEIVWRNLHAVARLGGNSFCRVEADFQIKFQ